MLSPLSSMARVLLLNTVIAGVSHPVLAAESVHRAFQETKASGDFNLRYENVDNSAQSSDGLTLRSRISITSGTYKGFSGSASFEDVRDLMGIDDQTGLIPDPEVTELDTAFLQYKIDRITAKIGRQVIALDNQRHIGHVGWRQDRQTFDAIRTTFTPLERTSVDIAYIYKYNRIFAEFADQDANSLLVNAAYDTALGKLTGYAYLLENESTGANTDTYGVRLDGSKGSFLYVTELASQSSGPFESKYYLLETGLRFSGISAKLGYERRGSDNGNYGFSTPLATGHAFNGWADIYLAPGPDGMSDTYFSMAGKAGKVNLTLAYHLYDSSFGNTDKGDELNIVATAPFAENVTGGIKYASYSQGAPTSPADRKKFWLWASYSF